MSLLSHTRPMSPFVSPMKRSDNPGSIVIEMFSTSSTRDDQFEILDYMAGLQDPTKARSDRADSRWDPWCDQPYLHLEADFGSEAERVASIAALHERLAKVRREYIDIELSSDEEWLR